MSDTPVSVAATPASDRHSPCLGICHLDATRGLCVGCGRTGVEIGDWPGMSDAERLTVYRRLPPRLAGLGASVRLLEWMADDILAFVQESLSNGRGAWAVGAADAAALVASRDFREGRVRRDGNAIIAETAGVTLRLDGHDKLRAFAIQEGGRDGLIVLGLPRRRADELLAARLGPKRDWLMPPAGEAPRGGHDCCSGGPEHAHDHDDIDAPATQAFVTGLARLDLTAPRSAEAASLMTRAAALPRYAVAMAVFDPAG